MNRIGYIRVSTLEQNTDRQEQALADCKLDKVFTEKVSGKSMNRPELKRMLDFIREGDIVFVESISRLARSTKDFLDILEQMKEKGVAFVSLKEQMDTASPQGKFMLTVFAALAELERQSTRQRQLEGIEIAKQKGKHLGRPKAQLPANWKPVYTKWKDGSITAVKAMEELQLTKTLFYRFVAQHEGKAK